MRSKPYQYIPTTVLEEEKRKEQAKAWADSQRSQIAQSWAQQQYQEAEALGYAQPVPKMGEQEPDLYKRGMEWHARQREAQEMGGSLMPAKPREQLPVNGPGITSDMYTAPEHSRFERKVEPIQDMAGRLLGENISKQQSDPLGYALRRPLDSLGEAKELGLSALEIANRPLAALHGFVADDSAKDRLEGARRGLMGEWDKPAKDILEDWGLATGNQTVDNVAGFIIDLVGDPTNAGPGVIKKAGVVINALPDVGRAIAARAPGILEAIEGGGRAIGREFAGQLLEMTPQMNIVPPGVAKYIPMETSLPNTMEFAAAVKGTPGAEITKDGLRLDLQRWQQEEQAGEIAGRTGVFYLPKGDKNAKHYRASPGNPYGGPQQIEGPTLLKKPLFVKGATGGKAPEAAYDQLMGKGAYQAMREDALKVRRYYGNRSDESQRAYEFLEKYGDSDLADEILYTSGKGNQLAYALQEHAVANAVRNAGYDAVVGYSKRRDGSSFISEVFDVRESHYPTPEGDFTLHPQFEPRMQGGSMDDLSSGPVFERLNEIARKMDPSSEESIANRIDELKAQLNELAQPTGVVRPTKGPMVRWSEDKLQAFAERTERNPYTPDWYDKVDPVDLANFESSWQNTGGKTLRAMRIQDEIRQLRAEEKAIKGEWDLLNRALDQSVDENRPVEEVLNELRPPRREPSAAGAAAEVGRIGERPPMSTPDYSIDWNAQFQGIDNAAAQAPTSPGSTGRTGAGGISGNGSGLPPTRNRGQGNFSEYPSGNSIAQTGELLNTGPTKKAGLLDIAFNRSRNVIAKQGQAGRELAQGLQTVRDMTERQAGEWVSRLPTVRSLNKADYDNFVDVAEGKASPINARVAQAAAEWQTIRDEIYTVADELEIPVGYRENYFPHSFDPKIFEDKNRFAEARNHLIKTGQAADAVEASQILRGMGNTVRDRVIGNLSKERTADLPNFERTKEALFNYIEGAARSIAEVKQFGKKDVEAQRLLNRINDEGFDAKTAESLFNTALNRNPAPGRLGGLANTARTYNVITKLGLGALTNIGQGVNTATVTGGIRTAMSAKEAVFNPEAREFALKAGVILDGVLKDLREGGGFSGKLAKIGAPGFNEVEKFNRTVAAWAGKSYAEDLAKRAAKGKMDAYKGLQKLGLDAADIAKRGTLTEDEQMTAARRIVERTQFKVDPQDLPGWASSPGGKLVAQFKTFAYNQTAFMAREVIGPAIKERNAMPLTRFILLGIPVGAAIMETKNVLRNRPSEEDPKKRIMQYFGQVGGFGVAQDIITGIFPMNDKYLSPDRRTTMAISTLAGPTVGGIMEGYGAAVAAQGGNADNLKRFALRQIPVAGGTLQNTFLPYKPGGRSGTTSSDDRKSGAERYLERMGSSSGQRYLERRGR